MMTMFLLDDIVQIMGRLRLVIVALGVFPHTALRNYVWFESVTSLIVYVCPCNSCFTNDIVIFQRRSEF